MKDYIIGFVVGLIAFTGLIIGIKLHKALLNDFIEHQTYVLQTTDGQIDTVTLTPIKHFKYETKE